MTIRCATVSRKTKETDIAITVALDGFEDKTTLSQIETSIPFLSHMLETIAVHGQMAFQITATGDIQVDPHHLIEDCGIVLGQAMSQALGGFQGIQRAGCFAFPMDGSLAVVALDLCGRSNLVWQVPLGQQTIGGLNPHLFREFFKGWVDGMRATLHIHVPCLDNEHHGIEAIFKAYSRALRQAVMPLGNPQALSTKGSLDSPL